ncbi:MAG: hypothetical protein ACKOVA_02440 [Novosphingobium sp.]
MPTTTALADLRTILLTLRPAGTSGFEGLAATCIASLAKFPLRLAKSGLQFGRDMSSAPDDFAVAAECKLYKNDISLEDLSGKVRLASEHLAGNIDLWALCSTAEVGDVTVRELEPSLKARGIELVMLDWPNAGLPPLAVLLATMATRTREWFDDHAPGQVAAVSAALAQIAADTNHAAAEANLRERFARGSVGLATLQASAGKWLNARLADPDQSRIDLGQVVGLNPGGVEGVDRTDLVRELASMMRIRSSATQVIAAIGEEGAGKTWLVARWWAATVPQPIPLLISGNRVDLLDPKDPDGSLAQLFALQEGSGDEATIASWRRRLQRWKSEGANALRFVLVLDGLNEHPQLPWSDIVRAFGRELRKLGGVICVTCRPTFWDQEVHPRLATGIDIRRINVVEFSAEEVKSLVKRAGHDPDELDPSVLEFIRSPRVLSVALSLIPTLGTTDLTREKLLLEYWRARMAERGNGARHTLHEFNDVLRAHAKEWRAAGGSPFSRKDLPDRDPAHKRRGATYLAGDLTEIEEGRFLNVTGDGEDYDFRKDALPYALGLLIDWELRDAEKARRDLDAELEKAIRPIAGFDLLSEILAAATAITSDRDASGPAVAATVRAYFSLQNLTEPSRHAMEVQLRTAPEPFLAALELSADDPRANALDRRLLAGMLILERNAPDLAKALDTRLNAWLSSWSMNPQATRWDNEEERRQQHAERVRGRLDILGGNGEHSLWSSLTIECSGLPDPMLDLLASRVLAGRSQAAHGAGLAGWGLVGSVAPDLNRARDDVPWTVRLNAKDHAKTAAAIESAIPTNPYSIMSQPLKDGMATALRLPGLPRLDAIAEQLSPIRLTAPPRRSIEHDPADVDVMDTTGLGFARIRAGGVDPGQTWSTFDTGSDDHNLEEAAPMLARHDPDAIAAAVRRVVATAPDRRGMALRQIGWRLPEYAALLDGETRNAVRRALEAAIVDPDRLPNEDRHWIVAWMARSLMPWLAASEQLELLLSLPDGMPLYLNLQPEFVALDAEDLERAFAAARQEGGERLRRTLFFASANARVPLGGQGRSAIIEAFFAPDTAMATCAAELVERAADAMLDDCLLTEIDRCGLDFDLDDELYWRQRAYAAVVCRVGRASPAGIPPRFTGDVAVALGGPAMTAFARNMDTLVGRLSAPAPEAEPTGVDLFVGVDTSFPGVTRWAEAQEQDQRNRAGSEEGDLEALMDRVNAPDGGLAADRDERCSVNETAEGYRGRMRASGFGDVVTEPQIAGIEAATSADPACGARWLQTILAQPDPVVQAQLANVGLTLAQALAGHDDELCLKALRRLRDLRTPVQIVIGPERIPLADWALVRAARASAPAALLAEELEAAKHDARLAELARFADALGADAWLDGWVAEALRDPHPARVARALTVTAFRLRVTGVAALKEDRGTGFLGQVTSQARVAARRRRWARQWLETARTAADPVLFWTSGTLAATVVDLRFLSDWGANEPESAALRFAPALLEALRKVAVKQEKERQKTLFGLKAPHDTFWSAMNSDR